MRAREEAFEEGRGGVGIGSEWDAGLAFATAAEADATLRTGDEDAVGEKAPLLSPFGFDFRENEEGVLFSPFTPTLVFPLAMYSAAAVKLC